MSGISIILNNKTVNDDEPQCARKVILGINKKEYLHDTVTVWNN